MIAVLSGVRKTPVLLSVVVASAALSGAVGCRETPSSDPPVLINPNMFDQERYNPEAYSEFFPDHRTMRTPVEGTVPARIHPELRTLSPKDMVAEDDEVQTGLSLGKDGYGYLLTIPPRAIDGRVGGMKEMLDRGQERFGIYCTPCHGLGGDGQGMVAKAGGFPPIPTYHQDRIRHMPDGQLFNTITNGIRTMPSYAAQIPVLDRWAIVAYVRALQLSQLAQGEPKK